MKGTRVLRFPDGTATLSVASGVGDEYEELTVTTYPDDRRTRVVAWSADGVCGVSLTRGEAVEVAEFLTE